MPIDVQLDALRLLDLVEVGSEGLDLWAAACRWAAISLRAGVCRRAWSVPFIRPVAIVVGANAARS